MSPVRKLAQFRALSGPERRIFLAALCGLPLLRVGLRLFGLQRVLVALRHRPRPGATPMSLDEMKRYGDLINRAARQGLFQDSCLTRSVLLCRMLQGKGMEPRLRIGVRLAASELEAHAWVEVDDTPVNDRADIAGHYAPFHAAIPLGRFTTS